MAKHIVAIVGRPNVGKSTLFNKLTGKRLAIVEDTPGVTRDRLYGTCEWQDKSFLLVDTGGIEPGTDDGLLRHMRQQAQLAIDTAAVILFVTDIRAGVTAQDREIAAMLLRSGKPVLLVVNKVDSLGAPPLELYDFYSLGLGEVYPVSSVHGHGTGDVLEAVCAHLPQGTQVPQDDERVTVAVIGRPNVGKSSLVNYILGEERMIVADEAGTTRDAVDSDVDNQYGKFTFIDTAGLRRRGKVEDGVERYSVIRSLAAVERARVCVILIDATEGFTEQDSKVAGFAHEQGKACIIAVNKWDAIEKDDKTMDHMRQDIHRDLSYMTYAPILFISGAMDMVGDCSKGVERAAAAFQRAGMRDVTVKLYPELRHEVLKEDCREQVYDDIDRWLEGKLAGGRWGASLSVLQTGLLFAVRFCVSKVLLPRTHFQNFYKVLKI